MCARGGPFEVASECSDAQIVLLLGGIVGTLVFAGTGASDGAQAARAPGATRSTTMTRPATRSFLLATVIGAASGVVLGQMLADALL